LKANRGHGDMVDWLMLLDRLVTVHPFAPLSLGEPGGDLQSQDAKEWITRQAFEEITRIERLVRADSSTTQHWIC
jgi:hypothetical protein